MRHDGLEREKLTEQLSRERIELLHPRDAAKTVAAMHAFLHKEGFYDQIYRTPFAQADS